MHEFYSTLFIKILCDVFQVMWDFEGIFRYSPMFYGYFSNKNDKGGYNIPLAYFCAGMAVYIFRYNIFQQLLNKNVAS